MPPQCLHTPKLKLENITMMGALVNYISDPDIKDFQPMGAAWDLPRFLRKFDKKSVTNKLQREVWII